MSDMPRQIRVLFEGLVDMPVEGRLERAPAGRVIDGTSFFPGGWGLWDAPRNRRFPVGGVLVLGNTWGTHAYFEKALARGSEVRITAAGVEVKDPTWRNLLRLLRLDRPLVHPCDGVRIRRKGSPHLDDEIGHLGRVVEPAQHSCGTAGMFLAFNQGGFGHDDSWGGLSRPAGGRPEGKP